MNKTEIIKLLDGRDLVCYRKDDENVRIVSDELSIDTTGEYFSLKKKPLIAKVPMTRKAEEQYNDHLFTENIRLFLEHAEEILSDSRMFFAPVKIQNGLAYTGISGFRNPTLGIYVEWWLNFADESHDNGNPIWFISGSPLSGCNACSCVDPSGKHIYMSKTKPFWDVWTTFKVVNTRYTAAKLLYEAYSLEEVVLKFRGEEYSQRLIAIRYEAREKVKNWEMDKLYKENSALSTKLEKIIKANKRLQFKQHRAEIESFYEKYSTKEKQCNAAHEIYIDVHKRLKEQLHAGTLAGDYNELLAVAAKEWKGYRQELSDMAQAFILQTFADNINGIDLTDILRFMKKRPLPQVDISKICKN